MSFLEQVFPWLRGSWRNFWYSLFGRLLLVALAVATGCAEKPKARPPDWKAQDATASVPRNSVVSIAVTPAPILAPPPTNAPSLSQGLSVATFARSTNAASAGSSRALPPLSAQWVDLAQWCLRSRLPPPACVSLAPLPAYKLTLTSGPLLLRAGSQAAYWDGLELRLGCAPQLMGAEPFLDSLDLEKTIQPLLGFRAGKPAPSFKTRPVIVLDPGHGGENTGTQSVVDGRYEKVFTLDWALRLRSLLATNGWQVFLTRSNDANVALSNRVAIAEEHKAGLFLSLHFNSAGPDDSQAGLETYCLTPCGMTSTVTRGYPDDLALSFPNNAFDAQNLQLACLVHRALLEINGRQDRGVRRARFPGVLRGQQRPAILIEGGYLSNPREARLIGEADYRQKLAEAVAKALAQVQRDT